MLLRKILPAAAGLAVLAAGVAAPAASAAKTPRITVKDTLQVSVKGTQKTSWTLDHVGQGDCDADQTGSGTEVVRFRSAKTKGHTFDGLSQPIFFRPSGSGELELALKGTVKRQGSVTTGPPTSDNCADGVGGAPPVPDCGTKAFKRFVVKPKYEYGKPRIVLDQADAAPGAEFKHCPMIGHGWPWLLEREDSGRSVGQDLPYKDLFEHGKHILIAKTTHRGGDDEVRWTTSIRWELTIKRLKREKLGS